VTQKEVDEVQLSEQADLLYQAFSRGNLRNTRKGEAGEMHLYLIHNEADELVDLLKSRMPGVEVLPYSPKHLVKMTSRSARVPEIADSIVSFLKTGAKRRVSKTTINKVLESKHGKIGRRSLSKAHELAQDQLVEWRLEKNTYHLDC
jgi:hypothetical protein